MVASLNPAIAAINMIKLAWPLFGVGVRCLCISIFNEILCIISIRKMCCLFSPQISVNRIRCCVNNTVWCEMTMLFHCLQYNPYDGRWKRPNNLFNTQFNTNFANRFLSSHFCLSLHHNQRENVFIFGGNIFMTSNDSNQMIPLKL